MNIFFIGSVEFSNQLLLTILEESNSKVVGIATKSESKFNDDFFDLSQTALKFNIPFQHVTDINEASVINWIQSLNTDVIFCFGWSFLLKTEILNCTKLGVIGYHPSLLPHNRGRHPIIWALFLNMEETGSTFFKMDEGADTGDILNQSVVSISDDDDASKLYKKLSEEAKKQVLKFIPELANGSYILKKQDVTIGNIWRKRSRPDGLIDFRMSSKAIQNLVRALTKPYVGAHIFFNGNEIKIWRSEIGHNKLKNIEPGKVLDVNEQYIEVKTYDGSIKLIEHEFSEVIKKGIYII